MPIVYPSMKASDLFRTLRVWDTGLTARMVRIKE